MIEFYVDTSYLTNSNELDSVILHDENGEHEPLRYVPVVEECDMTDMQVRGGNVWVCSGCSRMNRGVIGEDDDQFVDDRYTLPPTFCPHCGRRVAGVRS